MEQKVKFKSIDKYFRKEYLGLKNNTLKKFDENMDMRKNILDLFIDNKLNILYIEIENLDNSKESFTRIVTDVTYYGGYYIISYK